MEAYKEQFQNVPFGNSIAQIKYFGHGQESPERQYRNCLLNLDKKYKALRECKYRRKRIEIDLDEMNEKLQTATGFDKRRLELDIAEKTEILQEEVKLIEDALIEVETYKSILKTLPQPTREEFEKAELGYWRTRLKSDLKYELLSRGCPQKDTLDSLEKVGLKVARNEKGEYTLIEIPTMSIEGESDEILRLSKTNQI